jgi:acetylornithine/succinyldiaminopimelate/putrescine aminotransferase
MAAMTHEQKAEIEALFGRHINKGQVRYLKSAHLDVFETQRTGVTFTDPVSGKRMFDCFTCAGCFNVSRHNPAVMAALDRALDELDMGSFNLQSPQKIALAEKLTALAPGDLDGIFFASGGGEAIDCAIKLARGATGRPQIISTIKAYHGHTGFSLSANGKEHYRHCFEPLMPEFTFVPFNDLDAMRRTVSKRTAAVILEPIQGEAGIFPASNEYLRGLRQLCDESGSLLIFDEIQTAFGRTGKLFCGEHSGVIPDMMAVAKSLSGALYPNAALLYRKTPMLADFIERNPKFHVTYSGGSDLACCVSLETLDYLVESRLWENAERMGARLKGALLELMRENPKIIKEVRGLGLMLGLEYCHEFMGPMMSEALGRHGVWAAYSGNAPQVMRFMAPITVNDSEMDQIIAAIRGAVRHMKMQLPLALLAAKIPGVLKILNNENVQVALFSLLRRIEDLVKRPASPPVEVPSPQLAPSASKRPEPGTRNPEPSSYAGMLECKREGAYIYDQHGNRYLDAHSSAGTFNLGRRPPELVTELKQALRETDLGNFPMISQEKAWLAKTLADFVPGSLECCVFSVTRSEAMDAACKVARGFTGRPELITVDGGWYGQTGFALTLSQREDRDAFGPLIPQVRTIPFGDFEAAAQAISSKTAAVILEPVQAENHCRTAAPAYLQTLERLCQERGALLVLDETQTNFGRTGARFAFEHSDIQPDILILGEALGAGMFPIAATILTQRVNAFLNNHPLLHLSTFGGADIGCRVAKRAIEIYDRERPWINAAAMGGKLLEGLREIAQQPDSPIRHVAGLGLLLSLDLGAPERARAFCKTAARHGLLIVPGEVARHTVVLRPCLTITDTQTQELLEAIKATAADSLPLA